jgi:hypothetical protein
MLRCNKRVLVENNLLIARAQEPSLLTLSGERERDTHTQREMGERWQEERENQSGQVRMREGVEDREYIFEVFFSAWELAFNTERVNFS